MIFNVMSPPVDSLPPGPDPAEPDRPDRGPNLLDALVAVLRPLVRLAVRRGIGLGVLQATLKRLLVEAAAGDTDPASGGRRRPSQSRISLMTGVHRKDVREILARGRPGGEPSRPSVAETVMARWLALDRDADGAPPVLARRGDALGPDDGAAVDGGCRPAGAAPSFEALVAGVSRDVRPRAVLDEMIRLGLVRRAGGAEGDPGAAATDRLRLVADAHLPGAAREAERFALFAGNLADHAATAAGNLMAGPAEPRRLEQAVFHTHLAPESIRDLEAEARRLSGDALQRLNRRALDLQRRDLAAGTATRRFRFGVYFHDAPLDVGGATGEDQDGRSKRAADGGGQGEDGPA